MPIYQAAVLGVIQGLTEIFPVSSSGHLVLFPELLGWQPHSLSFDAALHLGTAMALLFYFDKPWIDLFLSRSYRKIFLILLASVPVGLVGLLGADFVEGNLRNLQFISFALVGVALLMIATEVFYKRFTARKNEAGFVDILLIGLAQTLALIPGVSRSGITILTGMGRGLKRERAAHFSFMISLPIVFAAGFYQLFDVWKEGALASQWGDFALGITVSFVVGLLTIRFLLKILEKFSLIPFAIYRIALGLLLLAISC